MIPVSMSRKTASFGQLIGYMDSEKSDEAYDLHHHCFARGQKNIAAEFYENSNQLKKRKNGNILYHEILSISLEQGVERKYAKDALRDITWEYINARCPNNMVYGCLHEDHSDHLHYHLMISANELGEQKPHSLRKKEFQEIKENLETHVLENYPKLKQRKINTLEGREKSESRKASAQKRRTGQLSRKDAVKTAILEAMTHTTSLEQFKEKLAKKQFAFYTRGKNFGVDVLHEDGKQQKYRFSTLGIHETYEEFASLMQSLSEAQKEPREDRAADDDTQEPKHEESSQENGKSHEAERDAAGAFEEHFDPDVDQDQKDLRSSETSSQEPKQEDPDYGKSDFLKEMEERVRQRDDAKREKALKQNARKGKPKGRSR